MQSSDHRRIRNPLNNNAPRRQTTQSTGARGKATTRFENSRTQVYKKRITEGKIGGRLSFLFLRRRADRRGAMPPRAAAASKAAKPQGEPPSRPRKPNGRTAPPINAPREGSTDERRRAKRSDRARSSGGATTAPTAPNTGKNQCRESQQKISFVCVACPTATKQ